MSSEQLRVLAQRGALGAHTHSHPMLGDLNECSAEKEIAKCMNILSSVASKTISSIAYPYGSKRACPKYLEQIDKKLGLKIGFTMERAEITKATSPYFVPRFAPNDLFTNANDPKIMTDFLQKFALDFKQGQLQS